MDEYIFMVENGKYLDLMASRFVGLQSSSMKMWSYAFQISHTLNNTNNIQFDSLLKR